MLGRTVNRLQHTRSPEAVWNGMLRRLRRLDAVFINLECAVSRRGEKWRRTYRPFHFRADPFWAVPALRRANVCWASLANNHMLDYGEEALLDTVKHLDEAGIAHSGAGKNRSEARQPAFVTVGDVEFAFVSFTDNTPEYAAEDDAPGVAFIEIDKRSEETRDAVHRALERAKQRDPELLVASLHWGPNMNPEPFKEHVKFARWLIDEGVDVVHGHSAHVFQAVEVYDGKPVMYDCGDFVDDYAVDGELRNDRGFLFELTVDAGEPRELRLVPTMVEDCAVKPADEEASEWSRNRMRVLSENFGTEFESVDGELRLSLG